MLSVRMIMAFEKTQRIRHIGHLDLMRAMQRALRRSGLPIRYSQGFNPHVVLSFASPLSVGMSGAEELADIALESSVDDAQFIRQMASALPSTLPIVSVRPVDERFPALMARLRSGDYIATMGRDAAACAMVEAVTPLLNLSELVVLRRTKRGENPCDIRPMIHTIDVQSDPDAVRLFFRVSMTERETLKPDLLLRTIAAQAGVELPEVTVHRMRLYGEREGRPTPLMEC